MTLAKCHTNCQHILRRNNPKIPIFNVLFRTISPSRSCGHQPVDPTIRCGEGVPCATRRRGPRRHERAPCANSHSSQEVSLRQSKFTETQIVSILKEADAGHPVNEIWRNYEISSPTSYKWKPKDGRLDASDINCLKELEHENSRLKRMYAELSLENAALKDVVGKKSTARRTAGGRDPFRALSHVEVSRPLFASLVDDCTPNYL